MIKHLDEPWKQGRDASEIDSLQADYAPFKTPIVTPKGRKFPKGRILCIEGHKDGPLITVVWSNEKGETLTQTHFKQELDFHYKDGVSEDLELRL